MKKLIGILVLFILVGCSNNQILEPTKFKTIMIKSAGEVETLPDMASFQINLSCLEKTAKASKECLVEKSNDLISKIQSFGVRKEDILTTSVNMNKSYVWKNNSSVFQGYSSSTYLIITIRNIEKLDDIYTELLENENLNLGMLNYSHSKLDSLKNEAYLDALNKSNILADKLLTELPESKREILKIGNIEISASMPELEIDKNLSLEMAEVSVRKNKSIAISKGTVVVNATLFVEYQIK